MNKCWCGRAILERCELPARRGGENFDFQVGSTKFTASVRRSGGSIKEVFLNAPKVDSDVDLSVRDAAVIISIALQYGVPIHALVHSTGRNVDGKPSSPIGAILDILVREQGPTENGNGTTENGNGA